MTHSEWKPWPSVDHIKGDIALVEFSTGLIEPKRIVVSDDAVSLQDLYDEGIVGDPVRTASIPDKHDPEWTSWECSGHLASQYALIMFENDDVIGAYITLYRGTELSYDFGDHGGGHSHRPVAAMPIPK